MIWLVMGVTSCGKTTLGRALANRLKIPFYDADDFHPPKNREKLLRDQPLTDEDRWPWLESLAGKIPGWEKAGGAVLACSALKESYRKILVRPSVPMRVVWIQITPNQAQERLKIRKHNLVGRFEKILQGQFADLEEPSGAVAVSAVSSTEEQVARILDAGNSD